MPNLEAHLIQMGVRSREASHARDLTFLLRRLVDEGFLESHGDRRGAWYTVAEPAQHHAPRMGLSQSLSQSLSQTSLETGPMDPIAEVKGRQWARRERVEAAILQVCEGGFTTAREIADRLGRTAAGQGHWGATSTARCR